MEECKNNSVNDVSSLFQKRKELMSQYYESLSELAQLTESNVCKLGVSDGKLYRSWSWGSSIQRNFRGESRKSTIDHISNCITDVISIYDSVFDTLQEPMNPNYEVRTGNAEMLAETKKHMMMWRNGLQSLALMYQDDEETLSQISEINASLSFRISKRFTLTSF